ncbi:MAG: 30S ribosomal protein S3 [Elusimicrobia bacterium]|nr:30S ribosomal protein S3 [Elusimicrobiota bacterium]
MGQKVHPKGIRLGYTADWDSKWFSKRDVPALIEEDQTIRKYLREKLRLAAVSRVLIERAGKYLKVNIYSARPGIVIGKKGQDIENIIRDIEQITGLKGAVNVSVLEIQRPELDARLVAEGIAFQLEKNTSFRRALKRAMERTMQGGAQGIKVMVGGRLGGAEIARREWMREGRVPLQTFRAEIDYGFTEAHTKMGRIGVKVWIFKKEHFKKTEREIMHEAAKLVEKERVDELAKVVEKSKPVDVEPLLPIEDEVPVIPVPISGEIEE